MDETIIRLLRGPRNFASERELMAWRAASPENEARYREIADVWARTELLLDEVPTGAVPSLDELLVSNRAAVRVEARGAWSRRWRPAYLVRAVAVVVLVLVSYHVGHLTRPRPMRSAGPELVTSARERVTIQLGDGSVVRLGPESRLRLPTDPGDREAWLDGRAFFAIARDDGRPFRIHTKHGEALVLGTRFEIQARDEALQVVVVEGTVALGTGERAVRVEAGEVGRVVNGRSVEVSSTDDVYRRLDWVGDFLAFHNTPLSQVAVEVGRRFGAVVEIADSTLSSRTISGWYMGTSFQRTMEAICLVIGAHCTISDHAVKVEP